MIVFSPFALFYLFAMPLRYAQPALHEMEQPLGRDTHIFMRDQRSH